MSRGPGRWQRAILEAIAANPGGGIILTSPEDSTSVQSALRRAAGKLRDAGKITLTSQTVNGRPKLVAYAADVTVPPFHYVNGMDGKRYPQPGARYAEGPLPEGHPGPVLAADWGEKTLQAVKDAETRETQPGC